jgi:peptide/nickel transport system permease protein
MWTYLFKRLLLMIVTLWGISIITFVVTRAAPGDPAVQRVQGGAPGLSGDQYLSEEIIEDTRRIYGFDKPLLLNLRGENYQSYAVELLDDLEKPSVSLRRKKLAELRIANTLAFPELFRRLAEAPPLDSFEGDTTKLTYYESLITNLSSIVPESVRPADAPTSSAPLEEQRTWWLAWWGKNRSEFHKVSDDEAQNYLKNNQADNLLRQGGLAVEGTIHWVFKGEGEEQERASAVMSDLIKKDWLIEPIASDKERRETVDRWRRWWRYREERFSDFSGGEKLVRAFTETQYGIWMSKFVRFDFDESYFYKRPVSELIAERLPVTLQLNIISILLAYMIAIPLGVFSAVKRYTLADKTTTVMLFILYSLPSFWVANMLILLVGGGVFDIFPTRFLHSPGAEDFTTIKRLLDWVWHLVLPVTCLTFGGLAFLSRQMRVGMLEVIRSDYVRTARAKGVSEMMVVFKHSLRNAVIPILTLAASLLPALFGGSIIIEEIFTIRGLGQLSFEAILNRDYPIINAVFVISAILTLVGILLADISYVLVDPRIKFDDKN